MKLTVAQLALRIGAELVGNPDGAETQISAVGTVEAADEGTVTFITSPKYISRLENSRAGAVIVARQIEGIALPQLVVKNVDAALIKALNVFAPRLSPAVVGIDPTAKVGRHVEIAEGASIGPGAIIYDGVQVGENTIINGGCKIGENSSIGKNCRLDANVVVYHNCYIGNGVIIQANSTIGATGFGYSFIEGEHKLIPHNGVVVIEDFVEIGANCCVDRAKFGETRIGAGTKIDNLVQIAHNVVIGKCCLIAGQVGISGSCRIGDRVVLAGQVGLADNIQMGDGAMAGAQSGIIGNVAAGQRLFGSPAADLKEAMKLIGLTRRLPKLFEQLKQLSLRLEKLEATENDKK